MTEYTTTNLDKLIKEYGEREQVILTKLKNQKQTPEYKNSIEQIIQRQPGYKETETALETKKAEGEETLTEADVETRAEAKAAQKVADAEFTRACNRLADAAEKIDKDFSKKVEELAKEVAPIPSAMVATLDDIDNCKFYEISTD
jgi:hypothetical protein